MADGHLDFAERALPDEVVVAEVFRPLRKHILGDVWERSAGDSGHYSRGVRACRARCRKLWLREAGGTAIGFERT